MNIQSKINKLLMALRNKGYILKRDTEQFLSEDESKMITKYILYENHPKKEKYFIVKLRC